jgi:hypothetical protein
MTRMFLISISLRGEFKTLHSLVRAMYELVKRSTRASWTDSTLTRPAAISLTIILKGGTNNNERLDLARRTGRIEREGGVIHTNMLLFLAGRTKIFLERFDSNE